MHADLIRSTAAAWLCLSFLTGAQTRGSAADGPPLKAESVGKELLDAHNEIRVSAKLGALDLDDQLNAAAQAHANDMAKRSLMTHDGADGSTPAERVKRAGFLYRNTAENVARGADTVPRVMKLWMDSPPHKHNILGGFTRMGVGFAKDAQGQAFWCVDFGTSWPKVDPTAAQADFLVAVNRERAAQKLRPFKTSAALAKIAAAEALVLAKDPNGLATAEHGQSLGKALRQAGYTYRSLSELAAFGETGTAEVVASLMKDEQNKVQLLGDYRDIGLGYAVASNGSPYWCLILARPVRD